MMKFKGKVTKEFIDRRNKKVEDDERDENIEWKERQWDFEFPERHQSSIETSGHEIHEGYEYDTVHKFFGHCDFKHVNRFDQIHISPYIQKCINEGKIDHIVAWKFSPHPSLWHNTLQEGDVVYYEILDYIPADHVLKNLEGKIFDYGKYLNG